MRKIRWQVSWLPWGVVLRFFCLVSVMSSARSLTTQEFLPTPPADQALIYFLDDQNKLVPLGFEAGRTPLHPDKVAKSTDVSYVEVKGEHAATIVKTITPRLFLFTKQQQNMHPP